MEITVELTDGRLVESWVDDTVVMDRADDDIAASVSQQLGIPVVGFVLYSHLGYPVSMWGTLVDATWAKQQRAALRVK